MSLPATIFIIGGPGSGKTRLAQRLAQLTGGPAVSLDTLYWDNRFTTRVPASERDSRLAKVVVKPGWVVEGAYTGGWISPALRAANAVVVLRPPTLLRQARLLRRIIKRGLLGQHTKGNLRTFVWSYRYDNVELLKLMPFARTHANRIVILRTKREVADFLANIGDVG